MARAQESRSKSTEDEEPADDEDGASETADVSDDEDKISPQLDEATNVLVDLIAFNPVDRTTVRTSGIETR